MSSRTASSKVATSVAGARGSKAEAKKLVVLKLSKELLSRFPHDKPSIKAKDKPNEKAAEKPTRKPPVSKASSSSKSTTVTPPVDSPPSTETQAETNGEIAPETGSATPAEPALLQVPADGAKKKGAASLKAGTKRSIAAVTEGDPAKPSGATKPRSKAPPKKRARIDGTVGDETSRPWTTPAPLAGHKLGPKANQGAINACLRALDRSGKPCRKWEKKGFSVKSFTGVAWHVKTWGAPPKPVEVKVDEEKSSTPTSNSENQPVPTSSAVGSDASRNAVVEAVANPATEAVADAKPEPEPSSPVPAPVAA